MRTRPSRDLAGRAARDQRAAYLRKQGWSLREIAVELTLSHESVRRILADLKRDDDASRGVRRLAVLDKLAELRQHISLDQAQRAVLRRELIRLDEVDAERDLDRLLGLA